MRKMLVAVFAVGFLMLVGAPLASAQEDPAIVKVPFSFIVGGKVMPAGNYRIQAQVEDPSLLMIQNTDRKGGAAFTATEWSGVSSESGTAAHVAFKNFDGHYFLSQVSMPGQDTRLVPLSKLSAEQTLVRLNLMPAERSDAPTK